MKDKESGMSRERVNHYIKILIKENLIIKNKEKGKMPYYIANRDYEKFRSEKRIYGLNLLKELFDHLQSLKEVKTAILFGSFARGDWSNSSDIDLFVYGDIRNFEKGLFESKIKREIQLFNYKNAREIKEDLDPKVFLNIATGFNIKGTLEPFEVSLNA